MSAYGLALLIGIGLLLLSAAEMPDTCTWRRVVARYRIVRLYWRRLAKVEVRYKPILDPQGRQAYVPVWGTAWDHFGDDLIRFGWDVARCNFLLALRTPRNRKLG